MVSSSNITLRSAGTLAPSLFRTSSPVAILGAVSLSLTLIAGASADIPARVPIVKYTGLWTNSPFTSKPEIVNDGPAVNPLDDFTLTGIAPVPGGYRITIISKKNPELKKVIEPGVPNEFTVVSVNRNPEKNLGTTVVLSTGSVQGTVSFEQELLTLNAPPAPQQQPQQAGLPPGVTPAQANVQPENQPAQRQPRPRIVPPPAPAGATPQQPVNGNNQNRPNRRNR